MKPVRRFLAVIGVSLSVMLPIGAEEPTPQSTPAPRPALVAVPSFQGELPDGTPVMALVVVPAENVLNKNAAWQAWEAAWPTRYSVQPRPETTPSP